MFAADDGLLDFSELLHQAALAACGVIFVNDALLRCLIEGANCHKGGFLCSIRIRTGNGYAGAGNIRAGGSTIYTITDTAFLVLLIAFDCGLNVSQLKFLRATTLVSARVEGDALFQVAEKLYITH